MHVDEKVRVTTKHKRWFCAWICFGQMGMGEKREGGGMGVRVGEVGGSQP